MPARLACLVCAFALVGAASAAEIDEIPLREPASTRSRTLAEWKSSPLRVIVFIGTECPLVRLYMPRLSAISRQYAAKGVSLIGVDANAQDTPAEVDTFLREAGGSFPVLLDQKQALADHLGATRTPEAFVIDQKGKVIYRGRIDDQFAVGVARPAASEESLREAIEQRLAGQLVAVTRTDAPGCVIGRRLKPDPSGKVTWARDVAPIVRKHCGACHRPGDIAPFPLRTHEETIGWGETIAEVVANRRMPPWFADPAHGNFSNDNRLSDGERDTILEWVKRGCPEGATSEDAAPSDLIDEWRIGTPDLIVPMAEKPFPIPAEGTVRYQWFFVDPGLTEDRWVQAVECKPSCRAVTHHATIYYKFPGEPWDLRLNDRIKLLGGYNPGGGPFVMPPGRALRLPAGSQIAFEMHYTPNGTAQKDITKVGLRFAAPAKVEREVECVMPANTTFEIPPGAADYATTCGYTLPADAHLLLLRPHMHLRGKSFRYEAIYPGGTREILLIVPRYDFAWQDSYYLAEPKRLPRGTRIECLATFDNSATNPNNPNPRATVSWGDQSWEEMMIGIFAVSWDGPTPALAPNSRLRRFVPPIAAALGLAITSAFVWRLWRWRAKLVAAANP